MLILSAESCSPINQVVMPSNHTPTITYRHNLRVATLLHMCELQLLEQINILMVIVAREHSSVLIKADVVEPVVCLPSHKNALSARPLSHSQRRLPLHPNTRCCDQAR